MTYCYELAFIVHLPLENDRANLYKFSTCMYNSVADVGLGDKLLNFMTHLKGDHFGGKKGKDGVFFKNLLLYYEHDLHRLST